MYNTLYTKLQTLFIECIVAMATHQPHVNYIKVETT